MVKNTNNGGNRFDIRYTGRVIEIKNYSAWSIRKISLTTIQNPSDKLIAGHQTFKNQLLTYLEKSATMNSFAYYFKARSGVTETTVKTEFRALMLAANNTLSQDGITVFNTIFKNASLRGMFDLSATATKTPQEQFKDIVANINNQFYQFIQVK